ncbi:MAG: GTPase Era, partial [Bacteroidia bacterium]|nr:GTPase Era [Bacteroidia bacterium]
KSTLLNALAGRKISGVSPKIQTTRRRIVGVYTRAEFQLAFTDTPGLLVPRYKLHEAMAKEIETAVHDADVVVPVVPFDRPEIPEALENAVKSCRKPVVVALNKVDLGDQERVRNAVEVLQARFANVAVLPISALHRFNVEGLAELAAAFLPESPPLFDTDQITDRSLRFVCAEIIREKVFLYFEKEVPYSTEVAVVEFKEAENLTRISAEIYVERQSQKRILIGANGSALTRVGRAARREIENLLGTKVFLGLYVRVAPDWRNDERRLRRFGY